MEFSKEQRLAIWVLVGLSLAAIGIGSAKRHSIYNKPVEFVQLNSGNGLAASPPRESSSGRFRTSRHAAGAIAVHVAGHVKSPGLYKLEPESRIADAVKQAGGPTADAMLDAVNLAAKVQDGTQIYVPSKKEIRSAPVQQSFRAVSKSPTPGTPAERITPNMWKTTAAGTKLSVPGQGVVNINTASIEELQRLPGVGPSTAQKILDYRHANGGQFRAIEELMDVKGIGPAKFEKMRPFLSLQ